VTLQLQSIPHLNAENESTKGLTMEEPSSYLASSAQKFLDCGDLDAAEKLLTMALRIEESTWGKDSLHITESLFNLGCLFFMRENFARAEELLLRCLTIERRNLPADDRDLVETVNTLTAIHVEKYLTRRQKQTAISA
jgi:hypothetical protein